MTWRVELATELWSCRLEALLGGDIPGTGLPVRIWRDPILFLFDGQGLFLDGRGCLRCGRGYLGLDRGYLGMGRGFPRLGRVVDLDGWLM
jgi:hypothetical protein